MKKLLAIALIAILALSLLTACNGNSNTPGGGGNNNSAGGNNSGGDKFEFGEDFIKNNLKGSYHIIYDISTFDNGAENKITMEYIQTDEGFYWSDGSSDGMLFIKNGDKYDVYFGDGDGKFMSLGMQYDKATAEAMMFGLSGYMTAYGAYGSQMNKVGNKTFAGRDCIEYTYDITAPVYNYKYKNSYYIDKETGVCLMVSMEVQGAGQKVGYEFEATKFVTSGVSLPSYK